MPGVPPAELSSLASQAEAKERLAGSLTGAIKAEARRLGFELVGVTTPDPPPHFENYSAWLEAGRHGEMAYLSTELARRRRADPRQILPECRSILVLGARYPAGEVTESETPTHGRVASYAWGDDYHRTLTERLEALATFIEAQVGEAVPNRWYTDTGPVLERDLAQRAGLGWIGKNTCLINPGGGSYFLLAEMLLGLKLQPDAPFLPDLCGSCTRCLEACPTDCILPDRTLDASRCISYLTIELKGPIPSELRASTGQWVFGCDICQQVCPWNLRFASLQGDPSFAPRLDLPRPKLVDELGMTPQAFNRKFKHSPVKRAKRRGYLRNVAVALGNSGDPEAAPALAQALLYEQEPLVRSHAAWALGRLGGAAARQALEQAAGVEAEACVLAEIQAALEALTGSPGADPAG
jgi:epoxyqueuosine reductase